MVEGAANFEFDSAAREGIREARGVGGWGGGGIFVEIGSVDHTI